MVTENSIQTNLEEVLRINVGGKAYTDKNGNNWQADQYFSGGNLASTDRKIANTEDDTLYQTERWSKNLSYDVPLSNGEYTVKVKFAEIWAEDNNVRVFDVSAEDQQVFNNVDIYQQVGRDTAYDKTFAVKVKDGELNLDFNAEKNNGKLSAIEIFRSDDPNAPAISSEPTLAEVLPEPAAVEPNPQPTVVKTVPAPAQVQPVSLSSNAITIGFENHQPGTLYTKKVQLEDIDSRWDNAGMRSFTSISDQEAYTGNQSLKAVYPKDDRATKQSSWAIPEKNEYYFQYAVKFENGFDFDGPKKSGGKLPGLGADGLCSGGETCNGDNGFSSRYMWRKNGAAVMYLYHMDKEDTYGDNIALVGGDGNQKYFEPGQWHVMTQRVKINSGNSKNGELDVWMDGEQVLDMEGIRYLNNGGGVDTAYFSTFHGGYGNDWLPERDVNAYFDDFVVSTEASDVGL